MGMNETAAQIAGAVLGKASLTTTALNTWRRNFNAFNAVQRTEFYPELIKAITALSTGFKEIPRLAERFAEIRDGNGSEIYTLTDVNPKAGKNYSSEYNTREAAHFLFGNHQPDVRQAAIAQPRRWTDAATVKEWELAAADFDGMINVAERIIKSLTSADRLAEWGFTKSMLFDAVRTQGLAHVVTGPAPTDEESARTFSARIGAVADFVANPSSLYNPARITKVYDVDELIFVTRTSLWQDIAKSQYSGAFQAQYMKGLKDEQFVTIPDEHWPADLADIQGVLISKGSESTVVIVDNALRQAAVVNPAWDSVNHTLTHRSVLGINPFAAMVVFKNGTEQTSASTNPVPDEVTIEILLNGAPVTELRRGYVYQYRAIAKDANGFPAGRADSTITGASSPTGHTFLDIDQFILSVGIDEPADSLTVTSAAVLDSSVTATVTLPVVGQRFAAIPPYDAEGETVVNLTPSMLATISGNTATPPATVEGYTLTYAGVVGGVTVTETAFTAPVTLTDAGDTVTVTATADEGYALSGSTTRTLNYS